MTPYFKDSQLSVFNADALAALQAMQSESAQMCVTSPPYFGLRDYGVEGQIGLEAAPEEFIVRLVDVFREVRRVLKNDGVLWVNIGDSYAGSWGNYGGQNRGNGSQREITNGSQAHQKAYDGLERMKPATANKLEGIKPKDLIGIPWMLAFALRADGWYLRSEVIWHKPNPMPESVTDRCTKSHEQVFLLTKASRYFYDAEAIAEESKNPEDDARRIAQQKAGNKSEPTSQVNGLRPRAAVNESARKALRSDVESRHRSSIPGGQSLSANPGTTRNRRSVWTVSTRPYSEAHFATFPPALIEPCILAGSRPGDAVLDPFGGSGTTAEVANKFGRKAVLIELNSEYCELIMRRNRQATILAEMVA